MKKIWYENGGRCISANAVSNFYVINNNCYKKRRRPHHAPPARLFCRPRVEGGLQGKRAEQAAVYGNQQRRAMDAVNKPTRSLPAVISRRMPHRHRCAQPEPRWRKKYALDTGCLAKASAPGILEKPLFVLETLKPSA